MSGADECECAAISVWVALQVGLRAPPVKREILAGDPSLRLKSASAQDDTAV
jgi:hypothetical protein